MRNDENRIIKLWIYLAKHRNKIYQLIIFISFVLAIVYSIRGYNYYSTLPAVENADDLMSRIFTPFVLSIIRFIIVMLLGAFIAMYAIAIPLKKMKVMQFEVEFPELMEEVTMSSELRLNQQYFITLVMEKEEVIIHKLWDTESYEYMDVLEDLLSKYEDFFSKEFDIDTSMDMYVYNDYPELKDHKKNRVANKLVRNKKKYVIKRKYFNNDNSMLISVDINRTKAIICITTRKYEFTVHDAEVVNTLVQIARSFHEKLILLTFD